ncbi:PRC-barrel domain-containing protein [Xinfangfangia sp. CPCC 101601]|uniref:PRC-barrel domain-containing protein n=1 Tax=Pseudogemmobacter lacusdianii TaxID=3069608 RepID=A0ABU0VZ09_9RHOB|nr:PRC-barrel domain-containing protein [Xinfangfangia sp. CPCC 101601]MDQ2066984.1 PRC-barrel domain-containing protein [Xinfangfangia sp. CPCC 101601]
MDHSKHTPLQRSDFNEATLANAPIYGADDSKIGTISHVHGAGAVTEVVIDVGGFLGIGAKPVLVSIDQLNLMRDEDGEVHGRTAWTKEQLKALPEHRH